MTFGANHAAMALRRSGTTLTFEGVAVPCVVSVRDHWVEDPSRGQIQVRDRCARIVTGSLPTLDDESLVTLDGVDYRVRSIELVAGDGANSDVYLTEETL